MAIAFTTPLAVAVDMNRFGSDATGTGYIRRSMGASEALWRERLRSLTDRGAAIIVATSDGVGVPGLTRAWGPALGDGGELMLAVTARPGTDVARHLVPGAPVSVTVSEMATYRTIQLSGLLDEVTPLDDDGRRRVQLHLDRFVEEAAKVGVGSGAMNLFLGDLVLARVTVTHAAEQTPGDRAGTPLETS